MLFKAPKGQKIIENVRLASTAFTRMKGLMFEEKSKFDYALIFVLPDETRVGASVHMMFVQFPIDIVYLDAQKKVFEKARLHPWMPNYTPKKAAKYFIELPEGKAKKIALGESLEWE